MKTTDEITKEHLAKLEEAFTRGFNDAEACTHAEIPLEIFKLYLVENPEFADKRIGWRRMPSMMAKMNLYDSLEAGDDSTSRFHEQHRGDAFIGDDDEITPGFI